MNSLRRFWGYFNTVWYAVKYSYLLTVRDNQIAYLNRALEVETRRRENLERILTETIHTGHDQHQCVLKRNDQ